MAERPASLIIVVSGPGGVGKGTIVDALVGRDQGLWLSRSWTTRPQRSGEPDDAYFFADVAEFERRIEAGGFLEWTEFLGHYYGTPVPDAAQVGDRDLVLEIELDGARQVKNRYPQAVLIFVLPPSREEQERRLRGRGDSDNRVLARLRKAEVEEQVGLQVADHVVVNDTIESTVDELVSIIESARSR